MSRLNTASDVRHVDVANGGKCYFGNVSLPLVSKTNGERVLESNNMIIKDPKGEIERIV